MTKERAYRPDIDGLRAFAVMAVVLFHAGFAQFEGGYLGVDVFFVISGYLITGNIKRDVERGQFSFAEFYTRRGRRLFPALVATLLATALAAALLLSPALMADFGGSLAASVFSLSNVYFWLGSGYFDGAAIEKPLLHTWSLSVEEQFYLIWPAFLLVLFRWSRAWLWIALAGSISLAAVVIWTGSTTTTFFLTPFRVYQFAIGALLVWMPALRINAVREVLLVIGGAALVASVIVFDHLTHQALAGFVAAIGTAAVLLAGEARIVGLLLRNPFSVYLGRISYSVYLAHWPVVVFAAYVLQRDFTINDKLAMVVAALLLGAALSHTIEQPFRHAGTRAFGRARYWTSFAAAAAVVALVGYSATAAGWPWRLGERGAVFQAVADNPSLARLVSYGGDDCAPPKCSTGSGDEPADLIVMGDSHSRQYYTGLASAFPEANIRFFEASSCQFFSPRYSRDFADLSDPAAYDRACRASRQLAFEEIVRSNAPVIIAHHWNDYSMTDTKTGGAFEYDGTLRGYFRAAAAEIEQLADVYDIEQLVVVGAVPTTGSTIGIPIDCLGRTALTARECTSAPQTDSVIARRAEINDALSNNLPSGILFVDPFDALCDGTECAVVADGWPIYSDQTHLSGKGSQIVAEYLRSSLVNIGQHVSLDNR